MKKRRCIFRIKTWDILEGAVLSLLLESPSYGYSLVEQIAKYEISSELLNQGVIYRILRNLETNGFISSEWETEGVGAARRVYKITNNGKEYLKHFVSIEKEKINKINKVLNKIEKVLKKRD